jgi:hypothetical protein
MLSEEEFVAALTAIHKYIQESKERPIEIKRGISYWKALSKL